MEKASEGDGNYAAIRDMGRLSLIVEDVVLVTGVVDALLACNDFAAIRIKNRLDPGIKAGYRDVQMLVREPTGGFIVEVQIIPKEMYVLKQTDGYSEYRFIFEACKRAKARQFQKGERLKETTALVTSVQPGNEECFDAGLYATRAPPAPAPSPRPNTDTHRKHAHYCPVAMPAVHPTLPRFAAEAAAAPTPARHEPLAPEHSERAPGGNHGVQPSGDAWYSQITGRRRATAHDGTAAEPGEPVAGVEGRQLHEGNAGSVDATTPRMLSEDPLLHNSEFNQHADLVGGGARASANDAAGEYTELGAQPSEHAAYVDFGRQSSTRDGSTGGFYSSLAPGVLEAEV